MKVRQLESPQEEAQGKKRYCIFCPGCKCGHAFRTGTGEWEFNGDMDKPTVHPSLLVSGGDDPAYRCHSFIRGGMIEFLTDCSHNLKGKTVPLGDF